MIKKHLKTLIVLFMMFVLTFSYTYVFAEEAQQENPEINTEIVEGEQPASEGETMTITTEGENVQTESNEQSTENAEQAESTDAIENSSEEAVSDISNLKSSDVYLRGDEITIDYPIDGNLYVIANKVNIKAEIGGDAFIMAKELNIEKQGYIFSNLFAVSDKINIDSVIYDMYAVAKDINITSNGSVYRDARIFATEKVSILGNIGRNAFITGNSKLSISDGDSEGSINGNLTYYTSQDLPEDDFRSHVSGDISFKKVLPTQISNENVVVSNLKAIINKLLLIAIIWLVCLWLAPKYLKNCGSTLSNKFISSVLLGILVIVATPIIAILLMVTKIATIPSLVILCLLGLLLVLSSSIFSIVLGSLIADKINKDSTVIKLAMSLVVGVVLYLVKLVPVLGSIVGVIAGILGIGSLISYLVSNRNQTNS